MTAQIRIEVVVQNVNETGGPLYRVAIIDDITATVLSSTFQVSSEATAKDIVRDAKQPLNDLVDAWLAPTPAARTAKKVAK